MSPRVTPENATKSSSGSTADRSARLAVMAFPVIIIVAGAFGTFAPSMALPLNPLVTPLLGVVMFFMGITLTPPDLRIITKKPQAVIIGCLAQYVVMPGTAWLIATLLQLPPQLFVGLVLLGSTPGGSSSNIVAYLARGNVALSVAMTSVSTLVSPVVTPFIVLWLAGKYVPVDATGMIKQILMIVIAPVLLGLLVRLMGWRLITRVLPVVPWFSVAVLSLVIAGIMAKSADVLFTAAFTTVIAVILQNAVGFTLGWCAAKAGGLADAERRSVAVEVGMQNAGLAAALASANYSPVATIPAAIATVWHNVAGSILAWIFGLEDSRARHRNAP